MFLRYRSVSGGFKASGFLVLATLVFGLSGSGLMKRSVIRTVSANSAAQGQKSKTSGSPHNVRPNISITTLPTTITQNFDTLPASGSATWTNDSTIPGWYHARTGTGTTIVANDGSSNAGNLYSYGTGTNTDRALGSLGSGNAAVGNLFWGILLTNNTGSTIASLDVSYTGEQWRNSAAAAQTVAFSYLTGMTITGSLADFQAAGTNVTALDFTSPVTGGVAGALNGNLAANRVARSTTISGVNLANGQSILLRWSDPDHTGSDHGLSIDDFSVTANGGVVQPTLNINDVTQAEGDSGQTAFNFTVSLTSPAGVSGVTFDASTADGTTNPANAGSDYVGFTNQPFTITSGNTSTTVTVQVNGDTTPEPNETFFVNITNIVGANAGDVQGLGTITNDDVTLTPIHTIQGSGNTSPLVTMAVTTSGTVTGLRSNGFFVQEPDATVDGDPNTSEGIFVFTSSAPPAAAAIGNNVQVSGTVSEFIPASDPGTPSQTELTSPTVTQLSTGNPLPTPHTLTAPETLVNDVNNLEKYEGMRVHVDSLTVGAPTGGNVNEVNATSSSFGDFYGVITGVARPFREPGIEVPYPTPTPFPSGAAPPSAPTFDANPERLRINSLGLTGSVDLQVSTNALVTSITGPLDYGFRTYTIDTDPPSITPTPLVSGGISAVPVPTPTFRELTVASFNMQRFFDTTDDPLTSDVVLTTTAFNNRLNKASLAIRNILRSPDVIGVEEMEGGPSGSDNSILQLVADKVNMDAGTPNDYQPYLSRGNDIGGINVGFLVRSSRITVFSVTQYNKAETFADPSGGTSLLNDRPPLVLRASITQPDTTTLPFSVIVNHLRSLSSINLLTNAGAHTRVKRQKQAESLATLINTMQNGGAEQVLPYDQNIVSVGDYNSYQFNDGYADVIGTVKGIPAPANQVVESSPDLNNPDLTDLIDFVPADQKYSYTFGGNAQAIDHTLVNQNMLGRFSRFAYARMDADFQDAYRNDPNRPERISDHDPEVAYFLLAMTPTAANGSIEGKITTADERYVSGAVVRLSGSQTRTTITDGNGNYRFERIESLGFYTVTPSRANYVFSPANRSFSQLGNKTEAAFTASSSGDAANPLDVSEYFVRQQYVDLLGREPDEGGFNYWSNQINQCGSNSDCISARRRDVAAAFFSEREFQQTGAFIYGLYKGALGRRPLFIEYFSDRQQVIGGANLETKKQSFAESFVQRTEFVDKYQANTAAESFVDALIQNLRQTSAVDLSSQRAILINRYNSGANVYQSRSYVVRDLSESTSFKQAEYNAAFVLAEYFGYLRRNPDTRGYEFWLNVLNSGDQGNYRGMVCAFISSTEYQRRFSAVISHSDNECSR